MSRPRDEKSKRSLNNYGLKDHEDKKLIEMLEERDYSARRLVRALLRQWIREGGDGGKLKYTR